MSNTGDKTSLIEFPTDFDLKIMGAQHPDFVSEILKAIGEYDNSVNESKVKLRPSSSGNYIGATVTVHAENQNQLDNIYRAVTSHPMVKVVF